MGEGNSKKGELPPRNYSSSSSSSIPVESLPSPPSSSSPKKNTSMESSPLPRSSSLSNIRVLVKSSPLHRSSSSPSEDTQEELPSEDTQEELPPGEDVKEELPPGEDSKEELPPGEDTQEELPPSEDTKEELPSKPSKRSQRKERLREKKNKKKSSAISKYKNPPNHKEIVEKLKNAETHNEVVKIIMETFPKWILTWCPRFCTDYEFLQNNWEFVCTKTNSKPLRVVLVESLVFKNEEHSLVMMFAEILTAFGHSVRRKEEFSRCKICGDAVPSKQVWKQFKQRKLSIPKKWSLICSKC